MEELTNLFLQKLKEQTNNDKQRFIEQIAIWIAEVFLSETQTEIAHDFDPPCDSSGSTVNTGQPFDVKNYTSLDSFIENEYNGTSYPSFTSGMGLFHNVYADELDELMTEWIFIQAEKTILQLLEDRNELLLEYLTLYEIKHTDQTQLVDEIGDFLYEEDDIDSFLVFDFPMKLREEIGEMDIHLLFKMGQKQAQQNLRNKEIERQKRTEELRMNQEKAEKYWDTLCKLHKLKYRKDMPHNVEMPYYDQFVYPILEMECKESSDAIHHIRLLGMFLGHKFSNSVAFKLSNFKNTTI